MPKKVVCINDVWSSPFEEGNKIPGPQIGVIYEPVEEGFPSLPILPGVERIVKIFCYGFKEFISPRDSPYAWPASHFVELDEFEQRKERIWNKIVEKIPELQPA